MKEGDGVNADNLNIAKDEIASVKQEYEHKVTELNTAQNELRKAEAEIKKLNAALEQKVTKRSALYAFISQVNQTIVHVKDAEALFRNSCRIAIDFGKFQTAWIGSFAATEKKIILLDHSGIPEEDIELFTDVPYEADGAIDKVLQFKKHFLCNNLEHIPEVNSWKPYAAKHNIGSCIVLPIWRSGNIYGTFSLYATEIDFFDKEDIALLIEVAADISFALELIEKGRIHKHTEERVIKSENRFRALIERSTDMKMLTNSDGDLFYASPSVSQILGYPMEDFVSMPATNIIHPDDALQVYEKVQTIIRTPGSSFYSQQRLKHKNGNYVWTEGTITNMLHEQYVNALVATATFLIKN